MQYLYVLVSTPNDIYYEQFLLSVTSLRLLMPDAEVVLLCDTKTKETLTGKRTAYQALVSRTITADAPNTMPQVEVSRWVKTSIRRLVPGDFLFIDCDTIVTGYLSEITKLGIQFGACLDKHSLINRHGKANAIIENDKKLGFTSYTSNRHFNGGIIYCTDTPENHAIFDRWHELWLYSNSKKVVRDQPAFNMAIHEIAPFITELDGTWNCQIAFNGLPFLTDAKIIHYFASDLVLHTSPFILAANKIFKKIKETGVISDDIMELLKNPKAAFESESRIIAGDDVLNVINSSPFEVLLWIQQKQPGIFRIISRFSSIGKKIAKFFIVRTSRKKDGGIKFYN
jgi:hypothetical protein